MAWNGASGSSEEDNWVILELYRFSWLCSDGIELLLLPARKEINHYYIE
jgi:hypothetical protein